MFYDAQRKIFPYIQFCSQTGFFSFLDAFDVHGRPIASHIGFCLTAVHASMNEVVPSDVVSSLLHLSLPEDSVVQIGLHLRMTVLQHQSGTLPAPVTHKNIVAIKIPLKSAGVVSPEEIEALRAAQSQVMIEMRAIGISALRMDEHDYRCLIAQLLAADHDEHDAEVNPATPTSCFSQAHHIQLMSDHLNVRGEFELKALSLRRLPQVFSTATMQTLIREISSIGDCEIYLNINLHYRGRSGETRLRARNAANQHPASNPFVPTISNGHDAAIKVLLDSVDNGYPLVEMSPAILVAGRSDDLAFHGNVAKIVSSCLVAGLALVEERARVLPVFINSLPLLVNNDVSANGAMAFTLTTEYAAPFVPLVYR